MKPSLAILMALAIASPLAATAADTATSPPPAKPAFVIPAGTMDATRAIAGNYVLDPNHVAVIARVSHMGFSISFFRFGKVEAKLYWDPANVAKSTLSATVDASSLETNVAGFAEELTGPGFLDTAKYPTATFVSTAFHQTDPTHGKVDGTFTLRGKSVPLTFDVTLVGAGPGFAGSMEMGHVLGIHAESAIDPKEFGLPALFNKPIQLSIDTEFDRKAANNK